MNQGGYVEKEPWIGGREEIPIVCLLAAGQYSAVSGHCSPFYLFTKHIPKYSTHK